ncbi:MAG TPA: PD-(D/E)XK nuclease-like domain-containing protein [Gaiellaceae bacterium]|jgi:hypothetical protein|nr:PD-(D/E)XK nuclease-like domain-containing protein [Gaiellaceae bacterium]
MNVEPIRFSWLKNFARSPAHAKAELDNPRAPTRAMDLGAIAHRIILGPRPGDGELAIWTGEQRRGKVWDAFVEEYAGDVIVRAKDFNIAKKIAAAVQADETAAGLLDAARCEVPLAWEEAGFKCETRGIDILRPARGEPGFSIWELKSTTNVEPEKLKRHAMQMLYPQQLEFYRGGLEARGAGPCREAGIIAVEVTPPHVVTCLTLTPALLAWARKSLVLWLERCRICLNDNHWPGFAQRPVDFDVPPWLAEVPDEEEPEGEEDDAA